MQPTNLTLEERERWAYAENDQRTLALIRLAHLPGTGNARHTEVSRTEVAARQQDLGFPLGS